MIRFLIRTALVILVVAIIAGVGLRVRYGGGTELADRSGTPVLDFAATVEVVANTDFPPGNVAVSSDGRVFFTLHPEGRPPINLVHKQGDEIVAWPSEAFQPGGSHELALQGVLSVRIDRQDRLWVLDTGNHGSGQARLLAFNIDTREIVYRHDFAKDIMGLGSHANDFQVDSKGRYIYIADASFLGKTPALVVHDTETGLSRRMLENDVSVIDEDEHMPVAAGRRMEIAGLITVRSGVDSIALDKQDEWLYYAALTADRMYRIRAADLLNPELNDDQLSRRVEIFAEKTMSDGITMDLENNIYLTDFEHGAVIRLGQDRQMETLLKHASIRWPDGFSYGPDGWLYFTCSSLHHVIGMPRSTLHDNAPYQVYRFQPGIAGIPGH